MSSLSFSAETVRRIALLEQEIDRLKTRDAGSGVSAGDHGSLTGLSDDDHPQYGALAQNETVTGLWTFDRAGAPLAIGASAADQLVDGLNADQVDGIEGASLVQTSRQINTGKGLSGGGPLSVDLTLIINVADFAGVGLEDDGSNNLKVKLGATNPGLQFDGANALELGTPGTLSVATGNTKGGTSHQHAITSSSNPGAAQSLLASDVNGYVQLERVGVGVAPSYKLHARDTANQLQIEYDASNYARFNATNAGSLLITASVGQSVTLGSQGLSFTAGANGDGFQAGGAFAGRGGLGSLYGQFSHYLFRTDATNYGFVQDNNGVIRIAAQTSGDIRASGTVAANWNTSQFDINNALRVQGDLKVRRSSTDYTGYIYVPKSPQTTVYNNQAFSTVGTSTQITAASLGIPSNATGVCISMWARDSGGANYYFAVGPTSAYWYALVARTQVANVIFDTGNAIPTDGSGNIYYRALASGSNTLTVTLEVTGYFI